MAPVGLPGKTARGADWFYLKNSEPAIQVRGSDAFCRRRIIFRLARPSKSDSQCRESSGVGVGTRGRGNLILLVAQSDTATVENRRKGDYGYPNIQVLANNDAKQQPTRGIVPKSWSISQPNFNNNRHPLLLFLCHFSRFSRVRYTSRGVYYLKRIYVNSPKGYSFPFLGSGP